MYIGKLAELTGASRKAIRLYEELTLIPTPSRKGQYRVYTDKDVALIRMIKRAQVVGFNLAELKGILGVIVESNCFPVEIAYELIDLKREKLRHDINKMELLDQSLVNLKEELGLILELSCPP
ncbi:MAG: MerR family transcriptional regulator [Gallionellaceae bacterium]|jgi:MerR family copper efflux transcriptional regulator